MSDHTPLSVFIHPGAFSLNPYSGISRYVCDLLDAMEEDELIRFSLPLYKSNNAFLPRTRFYARTNAACLRAPWPMRLAAAIGRRTRLARRSEKWFWRETARRNFLAGQYDLIHPSYTNDLDILDYVGSTPLVVTIHDMTHERHPESFASYDPTAERKKLFAQRAQRIIAISETTKRDIVELLDIEPSKIDVIYHGRPMQYVEAAPIGELPLPDTYLLFVGKREGYKNFELFLQAASRLKGDYPSLHCVCTGQDTLTGSETALIDSLDLSGRVHHFRMTDAQLALAYKKALAFVYPSYYEGFGLPILEAFTHKTPVVCARASCFPEIGAEACLFFDPHDAESLADTLRKIIDDRDLREEMIRRGNERLPCFSWQTAARQTLETYQRALPACKR